MKNSVFPSNGAGKMDRAKYTQDQEFKLDEDAHSKHGSSNQPPKSRQTDKVAAAQKTTGQKGYQFQLINDEDENNESYSHYDASEVSKSKQAVGGAKEQEKMYKTQSAINKSQQRSKAHSSKKGPAAQSSAYSNSGFDQESAPMASQKVSKKGGNAAASEDYSAEYSEAVSNNERIDSLPNQQQKKPTQQMINPPSMAQLQASPDQPKKQMTQLQPEEKKSILVMNSNGTDEDHYTSDNVSYDLGQQVASPQAFKAAKSSKKTPSNNRGASIGEDSKIADDKSGEFFLDEDNISV